MIWIAVTRANRDILATLMAAEGEPSIDLIPRELCVCCRSCGLQPWPHIGVTWDP